jgi:hypothetical protein
MINSGSKAYGVLGQMVASYGSRQKSRQSVVIPERWALEVFSLSGHLSGHCVRIENR